MSLFEQTPDPIVPVIPDNAFETLVGEGKKYKDQELLAKSNLHKDAHIAKLEAEAKERNADLQRLQDDLQARVKMEALLDKMSEAANKSPSSIPDTIPDANGIKPSQALTPEQLDKLLDDKLSQAEKGRKLQTNLQAVESKLTEVYGNQAVSKLNDEAKKLGVSTAFMKQIAAENPNAFFRLVGLEERSAQADVAPPRGLSGDGFRPSVNAEKTQKYYDELRRTNPALYHQGSTQIQIHKDALRLGEKFFDAD